VTEGDGAHRSTRVDIVREAIDDIVERLEEMHPSPRRDALAQRAAELLDRVEGPSWDTATDDQRGATVQAALDLAVEMMQASRE
jgi:hypothetical protein